MFKNFRVILRITPRDIMYFIKAAGRFIRNLLPALVFFSVLFLNSSVEVFASSSGGLITDKNPSSGIVYNGDYTKYYSQSKALEQFEYDDKLFLHLYQYLCAYSFPYSIPDLGSSSPTVSDFLVTLAHHFQCQNLSLSMSALPVKPLPLDGLRLVSYDVSKDTIQNSELYHLFFVLKPFKIEGSYLCYLKNNIFYFLLEDNDIFCVTSDCMAGFVSSGDFFVSVSDFNEVIETTNTLYFPKNTTNRLSYRTDTWFDKNCFRSNSDERFNCLPLYVLDGMGGFANKGTDYQREIWLLPFYTDGTNTYYDKYQIHYYLSLSDDGKSTVLKAEQYNAIDMQLIGEKDVFSFTTGTYLGINFWTSNYMVCTFDDVNAFLERNVRSSSATYNNYSTSEFILSSDLSSKRYFSDTFFTHFSKQTHSAHDSSCQYGSLDDMGFIINNAPVELTYSIDTTKIPDDYYVTISNTTSGDTVEGDMYNGTVYNYTITNPETGQSDKIINYVRNNYTFTINNNPDNDNSSNTSSNVSNGGNGDVNVSVDVDVSVNVGGGSGNSYDMPDTGFFDSYLDDALDESSGIRKFIGDFFKTLPGQITQLICFAIVIAILLRIIAR